MLRFKRFQVKSRLLALIMTTTIGGLVLRIIKKFVLPIALSNIKNKYE
jgi:hypothetical protein